MFDPMFKECVDVYQVPFFNTMITKLNMMKLCFVCHLESKGRNCLPNMFAFFSREDRF